MNNNELKDSIKVPKSHLNDSLDLKKKNWKISL